VLLLAGCLVVVLGGLRLYGAYRLRDAELALSAVLGDGGVAREAPVGGDGTAAPGIRAALDRLDAGETDLKALAELAMLGSAALSADQTVEATRLVSEHADVLDALRSTAGWPAARLGYWQNPGPVQEGEIQARLLTLAQLASVEGRLGCEQADPGRFEQAMGILLRLAAGLEMEDETQPVLVGLMVEHVQHLLLARGIASTVADSAIPRGAEALVSPVDLRLAYYRTLRSQVARLRALRSPGELSLRRLPAWVGELVYLDLYMARSLDDLGLAAREIDRPLLAPLAASAGMPALAPITLAGTLGTAGRVQIVQAGRAFARAALALRRHALERGAYPRTLAEVPEAASALGPLGVPVELRPVPGRGATLHLPGGDDYLRSLTGDPTMPSLLSWELPPPPTHPGLRPQTSDLRKDRPRASDLRPQVVRANTGREGELRPEA
jgi:hypothetical protein